MPIDARLGAAVDAALEQLAAEDRLVLAARQRLEDTQRSDGAWPSDDAPALDVHTTLVALRALRSAMAEEQAAGAAGGPGSPEAAMLRSRLMSFEASLRALREPNEQMPRI